MARRRLIDITPVVSEKTGVWPGDTGYTRRYACRISAGSNIDLSSITTTLHLGAHADGENHYADARSGARGVDAMGLEHYLGRCQVVDATSVKSRRGGEARVRAEDLSCRLAGIREKRVLLRTGTFKGFENWNDDFAGLEAGLVDELAKRGVMTVGIDTPSVDVQESKELPAHGAVRRAGMAILEGLMLEGVGDGVYELIALPLRLSGADASPVRAVLRTLEGEWD